MKRHFNRCSRPLSQGAPNSKRSSLAKTLLFACALTLLAAPASAADQWSTPYPGVRYLERTTPDPNRVHAVEVNLCAAGVTTTATKPVDRGMRTSSFAQQYGAQMAINAGFYNTSNYAPIGMIMGEGELWTDSADSAGTGYIAFGEENETELAVPSKVLGSPEAWMENVVSGYPLIVNNGQVVQNACQSHWCQRHPRTAVGLDASGRKLILAVVDGRWSGTSRGMTTEELGELMVSLGAERALNLDGGGSTTMYVAGEGGVVNRPSDGSERSVSNHLGVFAGGSTDYAHCCIPEAEDGSTGTFGDVPDTSWFYDVAETLYSEGVTNGCQASPRMFCPHCDLDRRHAAVFMARALGLSPLSPAQPTFEDVSPGSTGFGEIEALYAAGYVNGCSQQPKAFCPDEWLNRSTAAVMITSAMGVDPGAPDNPVFTDVATDAWYRNHVEFLHEACVVGGCSESPKEYCPGDIVTRVQFGTMLVRGLEMGSFEHCLPDEQPGDDVGGGADVGSSGDAGASEDAGEQTGDVGEEPGTDDAGGTGGTGGDIGQNGDVNADVDEQTGFTRVSGSGGCNCRSASGPTGGALGWAVLSVIGAGLVRRVWSRGSVE